MAERIERLVRGQKELLANVSHELRSPLARIRVALELLAARRGERGARGDDLETDIDELERLIEDVLATSRLEATGLPDRTSTRVDGATSCSAQLAERAGHDPATEDSTW